LIKQNITFHCYGTEAQSKQQKSATNLKLKQNKKKKNSLLGALKLNQNNKIQQPTTKRRNFRNKT